MCLIWPGIFPGQAVFGTERFRGAIVRVTSPDAPVPAAPALAAFYLPDTKKIRDAIHIQPMLYLTLTFDHRILDGAAADRFSSEVVHLLENWPHSPLPTLHSSLSTPHYPAIVKPPLTLKTWPVI